MVNTSRKLAPERTGTRERAITTRKNSSWAIWGVIAASFIGLLFWLNRDQQITKPSAGHSDSPPSENRQAADTPEPHDAGAPAVTQTSPDQMTALEHFKQSTRYPPTTRSINEQSFDLLNPGARHEKRQTLPGDEDNPDGAWQVMFTADRFFVRDKESLLISLQTWNKGEAVLPNGLSLVAQPIGAEKNSVPVKLSWEKDGFARTAVFRPDDFWPQHAGQVRVVAEFSANNLKQQQGSLDFYFTGSGRIPARFSGKFRDHLLEGDLLIDVGVDVKSPGTYRIDGNLFDSSGTPFGWARFEGELATGQSTATLRYYGLLFHDAGFKGPYLLKTLHGYRMQPGSSSHREDIPELASGYQTTGHYSLDSFSSEVNNSPRRQRMIEMYEDAERRGVNLTRPDNDGDDP